MTMARRGSKWASGLHAFGGVAGALAIALGGSVASDSSAAEPGRAAAQTAADGGGFATSGDVGHADGGGSVATSPAPGAGSPSPAATATAEDLASVPTYRAHAVKLAPPSSAQVSAYREIRQEADTYARGAQDYKDAITTIVTLHYEARKKSILGGLDREVGIEKDELRKAISA